MTISKPLLNPGPLIRFLVGRLDHTLPARWRPERKQLTRKRRADPHPDADPKRHRHGQSALPQFTGTREAIDNQQAQLLYLPAALQPRPQSHQQAFVKLKALP